MGLWLKGRIIRILWNAIGTVWIRCCNYSLAPEWTYPGQIRDVFHALNFIYSNAAKYEFDREQVFILGDSAGGNLSALAGILVSNDKMKEVYNL